MDKERLEQIKARLAAASEGKWKRDYPSPVWHGTRYRDSGITIWGEIKYGGPIDVIDGFSTTDEDGFFHSYGVIKPEDAEFIINAKEDIQWLIDQLAEER